MFFFISFVFRLAVTELRRGTPHRKCSNAVAKQPKASVCGRAGVNGEPSSDTINQSINESVYQIKPTTPIYTYTQNDININIPNDYSFNYKPHEIQTTDHSDEINKLKEEIETLKNAVPIQVQVPSVDQMKPSNNLEGE